MQRFRDGARLAERAAPSPRSFYVPAHSQPHLRLARDGFGAHRVVCKSELPPDAFLGYVDGDCVAADTSEALAAALAEPGRVFAVDDECVVVARDGAPTSLLAFARDGYCDGLAANVGLVAEPTPRGPRIGLKSLRAIAPGEELVYAPGRFYDASPRGG